jgi:hypothetical protein
MGKFNKDDKVIKLSFLKTVFKKKTFFILLEKNRKIA